MNYFCLQSTGSEMLLPGTGEVKQFQKFHLAVEQNNQ